MRCCADDTRARTAPRSRSWIAVVGVILIGGIVGAARVDAASVTLEWEAPTTNADGTRLTDLGSYRIYLGTSSPACPSASFFTVASPTSSPTSGQTLSRVVASLSAGTTYFARVTAVDGSGNESACSASASGVAKAAFSVTPSTTTSFGSVTVGSTADRTFTMQNTSTASLSGTATVSAPYSIVSGASFSLAAGASQAVTVRFRPTTGGTFASNVNFTAAGDTISRAVSGSGTGTATAPASPSSPPATPSSSVRLSVTKSGSGTVTSAPAGIGCGADCIGDFALNRVVALTATPAPGFRFVNFTGACATSLTTCWVTMSAAKTVTATFAGTSPGTNPTVTGGKITVTKVGSGSVTSAPAGINCGADCIGDYEPNRVVTLRATPAPGFGFVGFTGACSTSSTTCQVTMRGATTVTATFASFPLTVTTTGTGGGTVSGNGIACVQPFRVGNDCAGSYPARTQVTLTAAPASPDQSAFTGWSGACSGTNPTCVVAMSAARAVTATFGSGKLAVAKVGSGSVTSAPAGIDCGADCIGDYAPNRVVTLRATPAPGFGFVGFTGACSTSSPTCQVTMRGATTVTATFAALR
jgi:Divergent InlB B-repeat domain/Cep192 domain 4